MTDFPADWLSLRKPYDRAARSTVLIDRLRRHVRSERSVERTLHIADLGCGTGSALRALAPQLGSRQSWLLLDRDPAHLDSMSQHFGPWLSDMGGTLSRQDEMLTLALPSTVLEVTTRQFDLADPRLDEILAGTDLVTASALLDLLSAEAIEHLVAACAQTRAAVFWALSYDGSIDWSPTDKDDEQIVAAVNRHQQGDKGTGPALGPNAAAFAAKSLSAAGYGVELQPSHWHLGAGDTAIQQALLQGFAQAAAEATPSDAGSIDAWARRRADLIARGQSSLTVEHQDILAFLQL